MSLTIAIRKKSPFNAEQFLDGSITPSGNVVGQKLAGPPNVLQQPLHGGLSFNGALAAASSGPSLITVPLAISGSLTPVGAVANIATPTTLDTLTELSQGMITPAGSLTGVIDAASVTRLKSLAAVIAPTGSVATDITAATATILKSIAGTITPAAAIVNVQGGPSFVNVLRSIAGTITPSAAISNSVIAPPVTFFSQDITAMITPTGTLGRVVSGPSIQTIPKQIVGTIVPSGAVAKATSGPSLVTVLKAVSGSVIMQGAVSNLVQGPSNQKVLKSVAGTITPVAAISNVVGTGTPTDVNDMLFSMGSWELSDLDTAPQWPALTFTNMTSTTTATSLKTLFDAMRTRGIKGGGVSLGNANLIGDKRADGTYDFNFTKYKALVDVIASIVGIAGYISGGECGFICAGDEWNHPKWNGTIPPNQRKANCQYIKQKLSGIYVAVRMGADLLSGSDLPTGGWAGALDAGWGQYVGPHNSSNGFTPLEFYQDQKATLDSVGLDLVCGANWWNGGDGSSGILGPQDSLSTGGTSFWVMTPQEIRACADAAIKMTSSFWFMFWTNAIGSTLGGAAQMLVLQNQATYQSAFLYAKNAGLARASTPQTKTYFTDSDPTPSPFPPRVIPLGEAVRDELTSHKVFHVLDNARLQNAEYPPMNSDNSCIYFVRGGAGMLGNTTWKTSISEVQVGTIRSAFDAGFAGVVDGVIWSRTDSNLLYYVSGQAPLRIFKKNIDTTTVVEKDIGNDPAFATVWGSGANAILGSGLHSSRSQERLCGIVGAGLGVFIYDRLTHDTWHYKATGGKVVARVTLDDLGQYAKVHFTDNSWLVLSLDVLGTYAVSSIVTDSDPPVRDDNQTNRIWHASGLGLKRRTFSPIVAAGTLIYPHPKRSSLSDVFQVGRVSLQAVDEVAYESLFYGGSISQSWTQHAGEIYKINWAAERAAAPNKLAPEYVRQGVLQLTRQPDVNGVSTAPTGGFHVRTNGTTTGDGSSGGAWTLAYALSGAGGRVTPGTTVWIHGGTYNGSFTSTLAGASTNPIVVRQFPGERAVVNGNFIIFGQYTWYWGFEVTNTNLSSADVQAFNTKGPGSKLINLIIHDASGVGVGIWAESPNGEVYGCILYNNGRRGAGDHVPDVAHGIYSQNTTGTKLIKHNIVFQTYGYGLHFYTEGSQLNDFTVDGNIIFNNSMADGANVMIGGGVPVLRLSFKNNVTFQSNNFGSGAVWLGRIGPLNDQSSAINNYIVRGDPSLRIFSWGALSVTGNTIVRGPGLMVEESGSWAGMTFGTNHYYGSNQVEWLSGSVGQTFAQWRAATGKGATDVYSTGLPTGQAIFVYPNQYEPGRGHVAVVNWSSAGSASVDLSTVLAVGDQYQIRNVHDLFGAVLAAGTYVGGSVTIPLTTVAPPVPLGGFPGSAPVVAPLFHSFLVTKIDSGSAAQVTLNRGEWAYDATNQVIYVRCTDGLSPSTKRMVVFDQRFGTEEVVMVNVAGTLKGRLCRHFSFVSDPAVDVDAARGAAVSYDGSIVAFTTNWGGQANIGVYAALTDPNA